MALQGADVAKLRNLASLMGAAATELDGVRTSINAQLGAPLAWRGQDAQRFNDLWRYQASQQLAAASRSLADAANALQRNALEQEVASGAVCADLSAPNSAVTTDEFFSAINIAGIVGGYADAFKNTPVGEYFGKITSLLGLVDAGRSVDEGVRNGDGTGAFLGGVDLVSAGLGLGARSLSPLSLALGVFTTFVESTIPVHPEDYDGMRAAGARSAFGKNPEDLTDAQLNALNHRYDGPIGVAHMISDQMDSTADKVGKFFGKLFGG